MKARRRRIWQKTLVGPLFRTGERSVTPFFGGVEIDREAGEGSMMAVSEEPAEVAAPDPILPDATSDKELAGTTQEAQLKQAASPADDPTRMKDGHG